MLNGVMDRQFSGTLVNNNIDRSFSRVTHYFLKYNILYHDNMTQRYSHPKQY